MYTVFCAFDDRPTALRSLARMIVSGIPRDNIHLQPEPSFYVKVESAQPDDPVEGEGAISRLTRHMRRLVGSGTPPGAAGTYRDAIRNGSTVVIIHVSNAEEALKAGRLMVVNGAFDVEHRQDIWQKP